MHDPCWMVSQISNMESVFFFSFQVALSKIAASSMAWLFTQEIKNMILAFRNSSAHGSPISYRQGVNSRGFFSWDQSKANLCYSAVGKGNNLQNWIIRSELSLFFWRTRSIVLEEGLSMVDQGKCESLRVYTPTPQHPCYNAVGKPSCRQNYSFKDISIIYWEQTALLKQDRSSL